ncbi:MAG: LCP family protein [Propionibacteriaceae bacterium]|nr:LCP family protein [Propionibacteriaceae bacterium]
MGPETGAQPSRPLFRDGESTIRPQALDEAVWFTEPEQPLRLRGRDVRQLRSEAAFGPPAEDWETQPGRRALLSDEDDLRAAARQAGTEGRRAAGERRRHPFTRSIGATIASALVPGAGLIGARSRLARAVGLTTTMLFVAILGFLTVRVLADWRQLASWAVSNQALALIAIGCGLGGLVWVSLIAATQLARRPATLTRTQRAVSGLVVFSLSAVVSVPLAVGARYTYDQSMLLSNVFAGEDSKSGTRPSLDAGGANVWATKPRLNVLLLGADTDQDRLREIKDRPVLTDTIMVASIDTHTGDVALIQIPRNMGHTPFPKGSKLNQLYPRGYYDGVSGDNQEYAVNAIFSRIPKEHPEALGVTDFPGADALKLGVGEAIGLKLDYFVMVNIDGLKRLIDAMGGVRVNINERLPMGGSVSNPKGTFGWLEPGPNQLLDGVHALWYARSRWSTDDFNRMARQSCLINAVVKQADPMTLLTRYEAIAKASSQMVNTDIPQNMLPAIAQLALKVKDGHIRRVIFEHGVDGYNTGNPNFSLMRERVQAAINPPPPTPEPTGAPSPESPAGEPSPTATVAPPTATPQKGFPAPSPSPTPAQDVSDACGYHPKQEQPQTPQPQQPRRRR